MPSRFRRPAEASSRLAFFRGFFRIFPRRLPRTAAFLACAALAAPSGAHAQTSVLVSNLNQTASTTTPSFYSGSFSNTFAQSFTTGTHAAGYTIGSVELKLAKDSDVDYTSLSVSLWTDSSGNPGTKEFDFTNPGTFVDGNNTFTASAGKTLSASTTYHVVATNGSATSSTDDGGWRITGSSSEDTGGASNWSIGDEGRNKGAANIWAVSNASHALLLRVNGAARAANNAATGKPAISGKARVGQTLTAAVGTIADTDGLPTTFPDDYTIQWTREDSDGSNKADISGATSGTYTPVAADVGKKIRVKASFSDGASNSEGPLESDALPASGTVKAAVTVSSIAVTSSPAATSDTYGVGEKIEFTVTFSEAVNVSAGRPHFNFALGPSSNPVTTAAPYESGTGETALVFAYTVQAGDSDDNGIWIRSSSENTLVLETGEYIRAVSDAADAVIDFTDQGGQTGHKVDGSLALGVVVDPTTLTVDEGGTGTYTVKLGTQPSASVTVTPALSTAHATKATLSPTTALTFTTTTWNTAQTVTVSGDEDIDANNETVTVTHAVSGYTGVSSAPSVTVTVDDDENTNSAATGKPAISGKARVGQTLTASAGTLADTDGLPTTTFPTGYTLQWTREDSDGTNKADISGATSGTYTPVAADMGKNIRVEASFTDGAGNSEGPLESDAWPGTGTVKAAVTVSSVAVTSTPAAASGTYGLGEEIKFTVTFSEAVNVSAGRPHFEFSLGPSGGGVDTAAAYERGSGGTALVFAYTVQASDMDPNGIWIGDQDDTLDLGTGEYIRAVSDQADAVLTHSQLGTQSGHQVNGSLTAGVVVSPTPTPTPPTIQPPPPPPPPPPLEVTLSLSETSIGENGGSAAITATLNRSPASAVTVTVTAAPTAPAADPDAPDDFVLSENRTLTILAGETASEGEVTLTAVDNAVDQEDRTVTISGAAAGAANISGPEDLTLTIVDDDTRGVTVSADALRLMEGGTGAYTVTLTSEPAGTVTILPARTSGDAGIDVENAGALTFAPENWDTPQTVTVTAAEDDDPDDGRAEIGHAVSGADYEDVTAAPVTVTVEDDEVESTRVDLEVMPETLDEGAGATQMTVTARLDSGSRDADTVVALEAVEGTAQADTDYAAPADVSLTIAAGELSTSAFFALTPVDDDTDEADETLAITGAAAGLTVTAGTVTIVDDDATPKVTLSLTQSTIGEDGGEAAVTAALDRPSGEETTVTVSAAPLAPARADDFILSENRTLTILAGETASAGAVTLTAVDNDVDAADKTVTVSADAENALGAAGPEDLNLTITDDDTRGAAVSIAGLELTSGETAVYTVALESEPVGPVRLEIAGHDGSLVSVEPAVLAFSAEDWSVPREVNVSAGLGKGAVTLTHAASGGGYGGVDIADVTVSVSWSDEYVAALGGALDATGRMLLNSAGGVFDARRREAAQTQAQGRGAGAEPLSMRVGGTLYDLARAAGGFGSAGAMGGTNGTGAMDGYGLLATPGAIPEIPQDRATGTVGFSRRQAVDWNAMLWGRSFAIDLDAAGRAFSSGWTLWGVADLQTSQGGGGDSYEGELRSVFLGADRKVGENWRAGLAVSRATGEVDYRVGDAQVMLDSRLTNIYPYMQGSVTESLDVWAVGGVGNGEADALLGGSARESGDLDMRYASAGFSLALTRIGRLGLSMIGDAGQVSLSADNGRDLLRGLESDASRLRLGVEGQSEYGALRPFWQLSARADGGSGPEDATGLDLVAGMRYAAARVNIEAQGRWFLLSSLDGHREFSATAVLTLTARADGSGLALKLSPAWGEAVMAGMSGVGGMSGGAALWEQRLPAAGVPGRPGEPGLSFDSEIGYGFHLRGGALVTPALSLRRGVAGARDAALGVRYDAGKRRSGRLGMQLLVGRGGGGGAYAQPAWGVQVDYRF